jgi:hypothetical protein
MDWWGGDIIKQRLREAQREGINATMTAAVLHAKRHHTFINRTGTLEGSVQVAEYAHPEGDVMTGRWGSLDVNYAIHIELGTPAHLITPRTAHALFWPGAEHPVRFVHHPGTQPRPFLRPAADAEYPKLLERIRRAFFAS